MELLRSISIIEIRSPSGSWPAPWLCWSSLSNLVIYHYVLIVDPSLTIIITLFAPKTSLDSIEMFRIPEQKQWAFCSRKTPGILRIDYLSFSAYQFVMKPLFYFLSPISDQFDHIFGRRINQRYHSFMVINFWSIWISRWWYCHERGASSNGEVCYWSALPPLCQWWCNNFYLLFPSHEMSFSSRKSIDDKSDKRPTLRLNTRVILLLSGSCGDLLSPVDFLGPGRKQIV